MLKLKNVKKSYKTGSFLQHALKGINLEFRNNEFVAVLGPSGSGKTTLLNVVGGLDNYDSGDLIINGKSTKHFKDSEWDAYRNNSVGFIFQSYNLIPHITILENVEMGMTLSGINAKKRKKKALELLNKVGLKEHAHKKPNQLSGGQMQRVAIARALANNPDIILADEPTGALDTKTSKQIMTLIKEIAEEKLVIMVTHNPDLANEYANRIVEMQDGEIIKDSNPLKKEEKENDFILKKTSMNFLTALKLSFNNIKTKKGRTALTAFASSIGIIGIALILSLSNGFKIEVDNFEQNSLAQSPIVISKASVQMDEQTLNKLQGTKEREQFPKVKKVYAQDDAMDIMMHTNVFTDEYIKYLEKIDKTKISGISYQKGTNLNIIRKDKDEYSKLEMPSSDLYTSTQLWTLLPTNPNEDEDGVVEINYDVLAGSLDEDKPGLILQVDNQNQISSSILKTLGFDGKTVSFEDLLKAEYKVIVNDDYYKKLGSNFIPSDDYETMYNSDNSITVKINAIIRGKTGKEMVTNTSGLGHNQALIDKLININKDSEIVKAQENADYNILTHQQFESEGMNTKDIMMGYLGAESLPVAIYIYPKDFDTKDYITDYLDKYNDKKDEEDIIEYTDTAEMISSLTGGIMDAITVVLIAFSSISLVVSSIMIGIITYISVLERIKEIGILRALGARKKDIKRVFNAETFIIGIFSGLLGIVIAYILTFPTNIIIENLSGLANVAKLNPMHALILIVISMTLTIIGGAIPATIASKKDPVDALRTE